ncbi:MAG: hypothetical protein DRG76_09010 [Deltaproteobacteria bacterium]|nr:MAG: hypothetical protein DRG76_09010 [Deltaproteobacteria bacterium]
MPHDIPLGKLSYVIVDFTLTNQGRGDENLHFVVEGSIYRKGQLIHTLLPQGETAPNHRPWHLILTMKASTQKGECTLEAGVKYNETEGKKSVTLTIE